MPTTIKIKNGSGAPTSSDLVQGELAIDLTNKRLYTEDGSANILELGTSPSTIDINAGTIDGTVIGGASAAAGTFTTLTATGNVVLGDAATDTVTVTADVASDLIPSADGTYDLGASGSEWQDLFIDGTANIDSLVADTADINGGTIDGTVIGGASAAAGTFTTATATTGNITTVNATTVDSTNLEVTNIKAKDGTSAGSIADSTGVVTLASSVLTTADINGGTIDGVTIGGASAGAGTFTTLTGSGDMNIDSGTLFVDVSADAVGIGTTSPRENLSIVSTHISDNGSQSFIRHNQYWNGSAITVENSSYGTSQIGLNRSGGGHLTFETGGVNTASSEKMRIDSSGNVGIGTTSPSTTFLSGDATKLYVKGNNANASGEIVAESYGSTNTVTLGMAAADSSNVAYVGTKSNTPLILRTNATDRLHIDTSGNLGLGVTPSAWASSRPAIEASGFSLQSYNSGHLRLAQNVYTNSSLQSIYKTSATASMYSQYTGNHVWYIAPSGTAGNAITFTQAMTLDASGNLLVGKTSAAGVASNGIEARANGGIYASVDGNIAGYFSRHTSDGDIVKFYGGASGTTTVGTIAVDTTATAAAGMYFKSATQNCIIHASGASGAGLHFSTANTISPTQAGIRSDNTQDLGSSSYRFDDIYATNALIQTSDRNEKQDIEELSDAEQRVAVAAKGLLRKFRWKSKVEEKGDDARIHFGIIAQDLQAAFEAEGLDAGRYAMFIHTTWTDEETGEERSRMGVRYSELLAFIIAAI